MHYQLSMSVDNKLASLLEAKLNLYALNCMDIGNWQGMSLRTTRKDIRTALASTQLEEQQPLRGAVLLLKLISSGVESNFRTGIPVVHGNKPKRKIQLSFVPLLCT